MAEQGNIYLSRRSDPNVMSHLLDALPVSAALGIIMAFRNQINQERKLKIRPLPSQMHPVRQWSEYKLFTVVSRTPGYEISTAVPHQLSPGQLLSKKPSALFQKLFQSLMLNPLGISNSSHSGSEGCWSPLLGSPLGRKTGHEHVTRHTTCKLSILMNPQINELRKCG